MAWEKTEGGEWVWPLLPNSGWPDSQTTHLRVWPNESGKWHAAVVIEGDYKHHIEPAASLEEAQEAITITARKWLSIHFDVP